MIIKNKSIEFDEFPRFDCPTCKKGILSIIKDTITTMEPSSIRLLPDIPEEIIDQDGNRYLKICKDDIIDTEYDVSITSFFLECDREKCKEVVVASGKLQTEMIPIKDKNNEWYESAITFFHPKMFYPTIRLFSIPKLTPTEVSNELDNAFLLFWSNPSACANSLRKLIEKLVNEIDNSSTNTQSLHIRIKNLNAEYNNIKEFLLATKWIGNDGSHTTELNHEDVFIALEFIEHCLLELYKRGGRDLDNIAREINEKKKPLSKIQNMPAGNNSSRCTTL